MSSLTFALNKTLPIVVLIIIGYFIKRVGIFTADVAKVVNGMVFRVLLPAMLFYNIYNIENLAGLSLNFVWYVLAFTIGLFLIFIPIVNLLFPIKNQRGVILQSIFRSNYALVGLPLAEAFDIPNGVAAAALLSAFIIPAFNILGVICLCIYNDDKKVNIKSILLNIAKNPLIIGVCSGLIALGIRAIFVKTNIDFRLCDIEAVDTILVNLKNAATPMALLALGAQFEFSAIPELKKQIGFGIALRSVIVPISALTVAYFMGIFNGAHFAAFVAMFATPVAVSTVPMCQSMGADHKLAGQLVVWTTLISSVIIFLASMILKAIGVF